MTSHDLSKLPTVFANIPESTKHRVKELFKDKYSVRQISRMTFLSGHIVKRIVNPEWFDHTRERRKNNDNRFREKRKNAGIPVRTVNTLNPVYDPRRDGVVYHNSLTAELQGDPLPGRSAAEQKKRAEQAARANPRKTISLARL